MSQCPDWRWRALEAANSLAARDYGRVGRKLDLHNISGGSAWGKNRVWRQNGSSSEAGARAGARAFPDPGRQQGIDPLNSVRYCDGDYVMGTEAANVEDGCEVIIVPISVRGSGLSLRATSVGPHTMCPWVIREYMYRICTVSTHVLVY